MSKERRTVSLDPEVDEYLNREGVNASQLVNYLVDNHRSAGGDEYAMLKLREQQLESEVSTLEANLRSTKQELERVRESLGDHEDDREELIAEAAEVIEPRLRVEDNPAVENWAERLGVTPCDLLTLLEEHNE